MWKRLYLFKRGRVPLIWSILCKLPIFLCHFCACQVQLDKGLSRSRGTFYVEGQSHKGRFT